MSPATAKGSPKRRQDEPKSSSTPPSKDRSSTSLEGSSKGSQYFPMLPDSPPRASGEAQAAQSRDFWSKFSFNSTSDNPRDKKGADDPKNKTTVILGKKASPSSTRSNAPDLESRSEGQFSTPLAGPSMGPQYLPKLPDTPRTSEELHRAQEVPGTQLRPRVRHYFTCADITLYLNLVYRRRYAAMDIRRYELIDTIERSGYDGTAIGPPNTPIILHGDYLVPDAGGVVHCLRWLTARDPEFWANLQQDVFYFSTTDFPSVDPVNPSLTRLQYSRLRRSSYLLPTEGWVSVLSDFASEWWAKQIEKIAISTSLRRVYLVIPRDVSCPHGLHHRWRGMELNEDGFCLYERFVGMHVALQYSKAYGGQQCRCYLGPDPTFGVAEQLQTTFNNGGDRQVKVIVVIQDLFRC
ncbi:hypothetical protein DL764_000647 [Monosporascus ibericus]|uniref:Uncharacterized protein n=1 Tax=Monosporascus ibericus TaxID=155417 RepID=A0A4Q4TV77_9PEZI|nr:hypothetical protein DL764_000647 [Monosporascus ibericus]